MNMGLNNFVTLLHYNPFSGSYDMVLTSVQKDVTPHIIAIYPFITMPPWPHHPFGTSSRWGRQIFSRDEATLYERVSVRPTVRWSVTLLLIDLLGATNAVYTLYTALFS